MCVEEEGGGRWMSVVMEVRAPFFMEMSMSFLMEMSMSFLMEVRVAFLKEVRVVFLWEVSESGPLQEGLDALL